MTTYKMEEKQMYTIEAKLAGIPLCVELSYPYTGKLFRDYIVKLSEEEKEESLDISVTEEEILAEQTDPEHQYPLPYLESLAIYRKISHKFLEHDILLFHCSALEIDGKAVLFTAPSGTGKSTHARLWREHFPDRVRTINDDKPLLKIDGQSIEVYGTPYGGKDGLQKNISAPAAAIVILEQGKENEICRLTMKEAYPMLLNQTYRRKDAEGLIRTMDLVGSVARIPVYHLSCNISEEAVELVYKTLKGEEIL